MLTEYKVVYSFDKETGQVCAEVPALNHIADFGKDFKEAEKNITKAVELYLEHLQEKKQQFPKERARQGTFIRLQLAQAAAK
ncbi:MAG: type II toxin-antitoxin system HicB family antitoxin [Candidatus Schekmanbacteria bacterium]|nr:type II toxin-antitoxin system HicB family antitoxin [Candidatus Schekmanbacteria bacterium]